MEVQLPVYIRRYRKHFTSDLVRHQIDTQLEGLLIFLILQGHCLRKKNVSEYLKA